MKTCCCCCCTLTKFMRASTHATSWENPVQGLYPFLNKKFKDFSRTFKDTFPIFHFHCCGLAETTGSRWLNFVLRDQKVYLVFTQNIKTRALGSLQFLSKQLPFFLSNSFYILYLRLCKSTYTVLITWKKYLVVLPYSLTMITICIRKYKLAILRNCSNKFIGKKVSKVYLEVLI